MSRHNITLDPEVYEKFVAIAGRKGIKISPWINQQMLEFIEEEEARLARKREKDTE